MLTQILRQQAKFYLVNRLFGLLRHLFQAYPHQHRTANMISHDSRLATLTAFDPNYLFRLAVKLLNLPTPATRLLCCCRRALRYGHWSRHNPCAW